MSSFQADSTLIRDPLEALETHFGFREFLPGQEPVVSSLLSGRDTLAVLPTGGGKSLCYQLPAMVREGVTLVVSPLIALMKDQVDSLIRKGIPATLINSTLSPDEQWERLRDISNGTYKLVYVAPERFRSRSFLSALQKVPVSLFAVDEAHCLSQWGHDFRPDYLRLSQALEALDHPQTAAFTATATPDVRRDILEVLKLRDPLISVSGFERPNLSLRVIPCDNNRDKYERLEALVAARKTGIVYCSTRKKVEEVSVALSAKGVKLIAYHGGMEDKDREWAQNVFIDRTYDVAVATNAFGMGIDRPDVRFVAHFDVPGSIEAYYQEAGRAGRDGGPAECELLFNYADTRTQEFFIEGNNPGRDLILDLYAAIRRACGPANEPMEMSVKDISELIGAKNTMQVGSALSHLVRADYIERFDIQGKRTRGTRLKDPSLTESDLVIDNAALVEKDRRDHLKLDSMIRFCYDRDLCRQQWILHYFGEGDSSPCGCCDVCLSGERRHVRPPTDEEFLIARKALSGVARTCHRLPSGEWEARIGKQKIVKMLVGSNSSELHAARLNELSTHGILKELGSTYVTQLLGELEKCGLLVTRRTPYVLLALTRRGAEVMQGDRLFQLNWPALPKSAPTESQDEPLALENLVFDEDLYQALKKVRTRLAEEEGGISPFRIFGNRVLESFTRLRPTTAEQALKIHGVGKTKAERYLEPFLEAIRDFGSAKGE